MPQAPSHLVFLSEQAFFTIVTSALEAYSIARGPAGQGPAEPIEIYGNLWGHVAQSQRGETVLHVSLAEVDIAAEGSNGEVTPKEESFVLKEAFLDRFHPELRYLGDFHSHPYNRKDNARSALDVERKGWHGFSDDDFAYFRGLRKKRNYRLALVATIYKGDKATPRPIKHVGDDYSCIRFSYQDVTIWLKCCVYGEQRRISDKYVGLACSSLGVHIGASD